MINIWIVLIILFTHYIADFVFQTDWMAKNKSSNLEALLAHTSLYSSIWIPITTIIFGFGTLGITLSFEFFVITFICHTITDYFTSRVNTKLWNQGKVHWFFVSVGFDQLLHFTQLLLTWYYLSKLR